MDFTEILITVITVAGSTGIWQFVSTRYKEKRAQEKFETLNSDGVQYRDDLKHRVRNLEALLSQSSEEKDQMRQQVLALTAEVHALRVKVEFLEKENERLKNL
jgi:predicted nuclease with TOPRIM domain